MLMILLAVFDETVRGGGFAGLNVFHGMDAAGVDTRRCEHDNSEILVRPRISMAPLYIYYSHLRVSFDRIQKDALVVRRRSLSYTLSSGKGGNAKHASPPLKSMEICMAHRGSTTINVCASRHTQQMCTHNPGTYISSAQHQAGPQLSQSC